MAEVESTGARRGLDFLAAALHQAATLTLRGAVAAAEGSARATSLFKDRSGSTRSSIRSEVFGLEGELSVGGAGHFIEWGTAPHLIVAHGAALRFEVAGQALYRKMVRHPGTKERPFMREARERGEIAAIYGAEVYVGAAIRGAR